MQKHIVVVGGGVAGTAAANSLLQLGYHVTIIEKESRLGGRIYSDIVKGSCIELGAGFLAEAYTNTFAFLKKEGLIDNLHRRKSSIQVARNGKNISITAPSIIFGNSWLSFGAKLKLITELIGVVPNARKLDLHSIWKASQFDKQTITQHFHDQYGKELVDFVLDPILNSYFYWDPNTTSYAWAKLLLARGLHKTYILEGGLSQIPIAAAKGCTVLLSHEVLEIRRSVSSFSIKVSGPMGTQIVKADGVVIATTADVAAAITSQLNHVQKDFFSSVGYSSTVVAAYCLNRSVSSNSYAVAFPPTDKSPVGVMTVAADSTTKVDVAKLYASRLVGRELCAADDKTIHETFSNAVQLNLTKPFKTRSYRIHAWDKALPVFDVGSLNRLDVFTQGCIENKQGRLVFAGDYIGGPFIEGAFTSGLEAAERLNRQF